jgi:hypothetical protein
MLKYNIRKRKQWVHPCFHGNLNSGAYIVPKELTRIQTPSYCEKFFPKPNLFCPASNNLRGNRHTSIYQAPVQLTAQKQNQKLDQPFMLSKETNELQKHVITADNKKLRGNATVRKLACSIAWELSFSVFCQLRCNCVSIF